MRWANQAKLTLSDLIIIGFPSGKNNFTRKPTLSTDDDGFLEMSYIVDINVNMHTCQSKAIKLI